MRLPLTLRVAYHGARATMVGALILAIGWIAFVPATPTEAAALGAGTGASYPSGLREMRTAQLFITVAPDPAYEIAARAMGPEVSGWMVRLVLTQVAAGNLPQPPQAAPAPSDRDLDGPRFIQID